MGMISEFKEFALKGNFLDLAIGVIIGGAFGKIVGSMIEDIIMPVVGLAGKVDFSKATYLLRAKNPDDATTTDIFLRYGNFITIIINFIILAFILFLVVKAFNTAKKRFEAEKPAAAPAGPTPDQKLLTEIRDLLAKR
jgi:large conductance mechanosensitive channel